MYNVIQIKNIFAILNPVPDNNGHLILKWKYCVAERNQIQIKVTNLIFKGHIFVFRVFLSYAKIGVSVCGVRVVQSKVESRRKILCFQISFKT